MSDTRLHVRLMVTDTGPLITLAAADSLDYLLYPDMPVYVPDAVVYEATIKSDALGAQAIADWLGRHIEAVHVVVTQAFSDHLAAVNAGARQRTPDLGERAAIEAIRNSLALDADERALLLTEDDYVIRGTYVVSVEDRGRTIMVTTHDFLEGLEKAGLINSAEEVYRRAENAGRFASRKRVLASQHRSAVDAVERALGARRERP